MTSGSMERLLGIVARLRAEGGCSWDRAQTLASLGPRLVEEAYEAQEAMEDGDAGEPCAELGDLLFVMVLCSRIAAEEGRFDFADVAAAAADKLERRHPQLFGEGGGGQAAAGDWEAHKAEERRLRAARAGRQEPGALDGVASGLPALTRSVRLQDRAALVGFDWPEVARVLDKVEEELAELRVELVARSPSGWSTNSATSCSPSPMSPVTSISIPNRPCAGPMPASSPVSAAWNRWPRRPAGGWKTIRSKSRRRSGSVPSANCRTEARPAEGGFRLRPRPTGSSMAQAPSARHCLY